MKKVNFARVTWITCTFLGLIIILIMVMDYKIHYQYLTKNQLYFYECDTNLCVTEVKDDSKLMYSYYDCGYDFCPTYKKNIEDDYVLLEKRGGNILYDYRKGTIISQEYNDYQFLSSKYILVTKNSLQGMINLKNEIMINPNYQQLGIPQEDYISGYNYNSIIAKKDNKYGIISIKGEEVIEEFKYTEEELEQLIQLLKESTSTET